MEQKEAAAQTEHLTVAYEQTPVLWDVNLAVPKGALMAVVGPNGAGKTTLMKAMLGLIPSIGGRVFFFGKERGKGCVRDTRIGYVPQSGSVDWDFPATVEDVALMGTYGRLGWLRRPKKQERELAAEMLRRVGMEDFRSRQISELSGGQQQRVFLARALAQRAELYFMDEPFKGVDIRTERSMIQLLRQLQQEGKTIVVVHHDLQTVPEYFDFVTLINARVIASGSVAEVFDEQNLQKAYRSDTDLLKGGR